MVHGNGLTDWVDADSSGIPRPSRLRTRNATADIWSTGTFAYDGAGNVTAMGTDAFEYDLVSRLTSAAMTTSQLGTGTPTRTQAPTYDAMGNIQSIATDGLGLTTTTAGSTNRLTTQGAQYDSAGNMTSWSSAAYTYDQLGAMSSLETDVQPDGYLWLYAYNAAGQRVAAAQFRPTGGHTLVTLRDEHGRVIRELRRVPPLFADGFESQDTSAWSSTEPFGLPHGSPYAALAPLGSPEAVGMGEQWHVVKDYVYRNGGLLAAEERFPHDRPVHYHLDHLGTPRLITTATGTVLAHHKHYPFGEEATSITLDAERMKFTSHERELNDLSSDEDDVDYMRARYYSFRTGRFTSPDLLLGDPWVPQSWNRYTYVLGSPTDYVDPSGLNEQTCTVGEDCNVDTADVDFYSGFSVEVLGEAIPVGYLTAGLARFWFNRPTYGGSGPPSSGSGDEELTGEEPTDDCREVPPAPPGVDLGVNTRTVERARWASTFLAGPSGSVLTWAGLAFASRPDGPWDVKGIDGRFQDFGNFHFGAAAAAARIPQELALLGAGLVHKDPKTAVGKPWTGRPYGDDPRDQAWITAGYRWYSQCH